MKQISLLRHAQAADRSPGIADIDRPLTARGQEDSQLIGAFLAKSGARPDIILCSPSARTRETLAGVAKRLPATPEPLFNDAIYGGFERELLCAIKNLPDAYGHVLIIGHNPGMHALALKLAAPEVSDAEALDRLKHKYPKGGLAAFAFDVDSWRKIEFGAGTLSGFTRPKDLRQA